MIVIELCNTGRVDERDRFRITKHFTSLSPEVQLSPELYQPIASEQHGSVELYLENPHAETLAALIHFDPTAQWFFADHHQPIDINKEMIVLLDPFQAKRICYSQLEDRHHSPKIAKIEWKKPVEQQDEQSSALVGSYSLRRETTMVISDTSDRSIGIERASTWQ